MLNKSIIQTVATDIESENSTGLHAHTTDRSSSVRRNCGGVPFLITLLLMLLSAGGYCFSFIIKEKTSSSIPHKNRTKILSLSENKTSSQPQPAKPEMGQTVKLPSAPSPQTPPPSQDIEHLEYSVTVSPGKVISKRNRFRLLGTNIAAWYDRNFMSNPPRKLLDSWKPGFVRMPGGSWSDMLYWNGNGTTVFDRKSGMWKVDYSQFSPGFIILAGKGKNSRKKRKKVDVRILHDFIDKLREYAEPLVTVNFGTGNAEMASEWVRWANKIKNYNVKYWQIGNEMSGSWEAGHFLWGTDKKKEVDAKFYSEKYGRYADAMKKIDPSILVGAQIPQKWVETLLKNCPSKVDFVDHHYYFKDRAQINDGICGTFADVDSRLINDIKNDHKLIKKYSKEHKIEVGVTEWNVSTKGADTADMDTALLSSYAVGKMMEVGVDFATQWDLFTANTTTAEGHGMALFNKNKCVPKSQYWAFWVWSHYMADNMVSTKVKGGKKLFAFSTATANGKLYIMLINIEPYRNVSANIDIVDGAYGNKARSILLSRASYFWNPNTMKIEWSRKPDISYLHASSRFKAVVPPYSIRVLEIPVKRSKNDSDISAAASSWKPKKPARLKFFLPDDAPPSLSYNGALALLDENGDPIVPPPSSPAKITITGPAKLNLSDISMDGGVGTFKILPEHGASGYLTLKAEFEGMTVSRSMNIRLARYIDVPLLNFDSDKQLQNISSRPGTKLKINYTRKPNQGVLEADISKVPPTKSTQSTNIFFLVNMKKMKVPGKISGLFFDAKLSSNFNQESIKIAVRLDGALVGEAVLKKNTQNFTHIKLIENAVNKQEKLKNPNFCVFMFAQPKGKYKGKIYIDNFGVIELR